MTLVCLIFTRARIYIKRYKMVLKGVKCFDMLKLEENRKFFLEIFGGFRKS